MFLISCLNKLMNWACQITLISKIFFFKLGFDFLGEFYPGFRQTIFFFNLIFLQSPEVDFHSALKRNFFIQQKLLLPALIRTRILWKLLKGLFCPGMDVFLVSPKYGQEEKMCEMKGYLVDNVLGWVLSNNAALIVPGVQWIQT